jgi:hypothetical protein
MFSKKDPLERFKYSIRQKEMHMGNNEHQKATIIAFVAIVAILLFGATPILESFDASITGAVTGVTDEHEKCLANGKFNGKYDWDFIQRCRDFVDDYEKGHNKYTPRSLLSRDAGAYNEFLKQEAELKDTGLGSLFTEE